MSRAGARDPGTQLRAVRAELLAPAPRAALAVGAPPAGPASFAGDVPLAERPAPAGTAAPGAAVPQVPGGAFPAATRVLAVVARPGQESADLGAVLATARLRGSWLAVLCLTRGEASERNSSGERLEVIRPWELQVAAGLLGASSVTIADYPDGRLANVPPGRLAEHIGRAAERARAGLILVVDPAAAGDPDTPAVAAAAMLAARRLGLPVLARTVPGPGSRWRAALGPQAATARTRQRHAIEAHRSQRLPGAGAGAAWAAAPGPGPGGPGPVDGGAGPAGDWEMLRWLTAPLPAPRAGVRG